MLERCTFVRFPKIFSRVCGLIVSASAIPESASKLIHLD